MLNEIKTQVRPGYACINLTLNRSFKTYRLSTVENKEKDKIVKTILNNIQLFKDIVVHNIVNNIYVYRVSSDLVPFATQPYVKEIYQKVILNDKEVQENLTGIKGLQEKFNLRLSIHPSQFNVLASPKCDVVKRSVEEINAQTEWIRAVNGSNVVIHVGGGYGNKDEAIKRFKKHLNYIDTSLISIENDDKTYSAYDIFQICEPLKLKWVYDFHHDRCKPSPDISISELIESYPPDKYHLSSGKPHFNSTAHADFITKEDYSQFLKLLAKCSIQKADVIFEAKQKNLAISTLLKPSKDGHWQLE